MTLTGAAWPRSRVLGLGAALLFLAGAVGYYLGTADADDAPGRSSVDVGFLYDMIAHHSQALELSSLELGGGEEDQVKVFAEEILQFQSYEIGLMEAYLSRWGHDPDDRPERAMTWMGTDVAPASMPGMASDADVDALAAAEGRDADARFIELMTLHHEGGVHMAAHAADHASDPSVRRLAEVVERNQRIEIRELEATREALGLD